LRDDGHRWAEKRNWVSDDDLAWWHTHHE
jgi:hypothetical protein